MSIESQLNFENYLAGKPLNPELEALQEGRLPEIGPFLVTGPGERENQSHIDGKTVISRADRVALKEFRVSPAWVVLHRLLENATLTHQESATLLSQEDPFGKGQEIAQAWAYVKMLKRVTRDIALMVEGEIAELEKEEPGETKPAV